MEGQFKKYQLLHHIKACLEDNNEWTFWSINDDVYNFIPILVKLANKYPGPIIEFGCCLGHSAICIASAKPINKKLITIDWFKNNQLGVSNNAHRTMTQRNLKYVIDYANVELVDSDIGEFIQNYNGNSPSMVFLDSNHNAKCVNREIDFAIKWKVPIICGHDYSDEFPDVKKCVHNKFPNHKINIYSNLWWVEYNKEKK